MRHLCASFLSRNNLPVLAKRHSVHIAFFTSVEAEQALRAEPLFRRLEATPSTSCTIRPTSSPTRHRWRPLAATKVPYSEHSLAFYYERNCKFALMSCAHYAGWQPAVRPMRS